MIAPASGTERLRAVDPVSRGVARAVDGLVRRVPALGSLRDTLERVVRFAGVGLFSSLAYAAAVPIFATGLHVSPRISAVCGYCVVIPLNFLLHRHFTFRSARDMRGDLARYAWAQAVGLSVSYGAMAFCVDLLRLPYACGIVAAIALVPVVTYLLLDQWVFAGKTT